MARNKLTVFQTLERALKGNWNSDQGTTHINSYDMSGANSVLYKTTDKADYEKTKLELQQNRYLKDRWVKANVDLSVSAFSNLSNVKLMYRDADLMDSFPEIGAALDTVSEESCLVSSNSGQIVNVYSKSDRIKAILEDLFVNRLNLQVTAPMIIRQMCKYGNQFMLLDIDNKLGVKDWKQLPVFNVERLENGIQNPYGSNGWSLAVNNGATDDKDLSTKFVWYDENNSQVPFRNWQIAHFRLLTNSMCLPYGCLVGDTRIETENGYKEMSSIGIGDKVWTFNVNSQKRELATVSMFMPKGKKDVYKVSTYHNEIEGTDDHKLLTYNGKNLEYKEIKELKIGDLLIIDNSYNKQNNKIKIDKSYPTEKEANLNKNMVWWKNHIDYIPDYIDEEFAKFFGFMIGDGWITQNKYIYFATGEYEKFNIEFAKHIEKITNHKCKFLKPYISENKNYDYSSCVASSKCLSLIMHRMGFIDGFDKKRIPEWVYASNDNIKKAFINGLMIADGSYNIDKYGVLRCGIEMSNEQLIKDMKTLVQSLGYKSSKVSSRNRVGSQIASNNSRSIITKNTSYYFYFYESLNTQEKKYDLLNRLENGFKTERVRKIEYVGEKETYDFTVDNDNSNFFANGIVTHNCSYLNSARRHWRLLSLMEDMMLIYRLERSIERRVYKIYVGAIDDADVQAYVENIANNFKRTPIIDPMTGQIDLRKNILDVSQDLFIPVRDANAPTPIDTLPAAQNLTAIDDIKYIQNKVLTALRIPKSFLNFEENAGDGKNLALMDIRFTRVINRIQQAFLMELTKVASIHLYLLGFEDDLTNFNLTMNNPSTQAEQLEIDNVQKKITAFRDAVSDPGNGLPAMSYTRASKEILKWSDKEIKDNLEEIRLERAISAELEKTVQIIKRTGIFDTVDRVYGEPGAEYQEDMQQGGPDDGMGGGMPGGGGGGGFGGGLDDLGAPGMEDEGDLTGEEGAEPTTDMGGGEPDMDMGNAPEGGTNETHRSKKPLLIESTLNKELKRSKSHTDELFEKYVSRLNIDEERKRKSDVNIVERTKIYDKSLLINEEFNKMIESLNELDNDKEEAVE